jgi:hypothetical protein
MKKILTAGLTGLALTGLALTGLAVAGLAVAGSIGADAGSAVADATDLGNAQLPSVVPLSGVLGPQGKPASADAAVEGLLAGR